MVRRLIVSISVLFLLSSCSTFRPLNFTSNKQVSAVQPSLVTTQPSRFIEDIAVIPQVAQDKTEVKSGPSASIAEKPLNIIEPVKQDVLQAESIFANREAVVEKASPVQFKYAVLLNTEVESLPSKALLESVDEWYGVRYRTGGNTKSGVDCSGFTVAVYASVFGFALPRVSREQYRISRKISTTELQQGDLVFFNTNGSGVSHVGVYLGNNKFIHASVSRGVMVNDLFESYYIKRFVGAGRIENKQMIASED